MASFSSSSSRSPHHRLLLLLLPLAILLLLTPTPTLASSGDTSPLFKFCISKCIPKCEPSPTSITSSNVFLRATRWTCEDECKYDCMRVLTDKGDGGTEQFYGKWPFKRMFGVQEPASVVFSLMNGYMHWKGLRELRRRILPGNPLRTLYLIFGVLGVNTWVWSTVFHTRDKPWTEKADYFSAGLAVTYSTFLVFVRIWHFYPTSSSTSSYASTKPSSSSSSGSLSYPTRFKQLAAFFTLMFIGHITYLCKASSFDYGYNMFYSLTLGLIHNVLWILFSRPSLLPLFLRPYLRIPQAYPSSSAVSYPLYISILFFLAVSLEFFDFPPLGGVLDAHSLWHLATVGIVPLWYSFFREDAGWVGWEGNGSGGA
ncbi:Per1-like-domain-containing protein [Mrakia frigida]|uniref:Per1p n=1 Tax=Mrakia frigida TaxID=29902 RepID=UPI003FCBF772